MDLKKEADIALCDILRRSSGGISRRRSLDVRDFILISGAVVYDGEGLL